MMNIKNCQSIHYSRVETPSTADYSHPLITNTGKKTELVSYVVAQIGQVCSHNGKLFRPVFFGKLLIIRNKIIKLFSGMLCAECWLPVIKRKTAMKSIEDEVNNNLLHTYLYVAYLDKIHELNNIRSNQKDVFLSQLCSKPGYNNMLCLNLIMSDESLLSTAI